MTEALTQATTEADVAGVTVGAATEALGAVAVALALRRDHGLEVVRAVGYPEAVLATAAGSGWGTRSRCRTWRAPASRCGRSTRRTGGAGSARRSAASGRPGWLPLRIGGRTVGAMGFRFGHDEHHFDPDERDPMEALARLASQTLERSRLLAGEHQARLAAQRPETRAGLIARAATAVDVEIGAHERLQRLADVIVPEVATQPDRDHRSRRGPPRPRRRPPGPRRGGPARRALPAHAARPGPAVGAGAGAAPASRSS